VSKEKIAVLTSKESWFLPFAKVLASKLQDKGYRAQLFTGHKEISRSFETVFILSYFKIVEKKFLSLHKYNLVVHESNLPHGAGWAPLFWQVLEGKNRIPVVLFEAGAKPDAGEILIKDYICLKGNELNSEIRQKQAEKTIELCMNFIGKKMKLRPKKQKGKTSVYRKRAPADSKLNPNKTIKEQFNLFRIAHNEDYPVFFNHKGQKYILKIYKGDKR